MAHVKRTNMDVNEYRHENQKQENGAPNAGGSAHALTSYFFCKI
jgi:hypothetical protein